MILAFGHSSRVGKDTASKAVADRAFWSSDKWSEVKLTSFAAPLKATAFDLFRHYGLMQAQFYEEPGNAHLRDVPLCIGKTPVEVWVLVGNLMRSIYEHVWVDKALSQHDPGSLLVLSDLRFPNEFNKIKERGGACIRVVREGQVVKASDAFLDETWPWDATIVNDGSINKLRREAISVARTLLSGVTK